jgi:hypothetical protein
MELSYASDDRKGAVDGVNIFSFYVNCIGAMLAMKEKARIAYLLRRSSPTPQPMAAIKNLPTSKLVKLIPRDTRYISHECLPQNAPLLVCTTCEK